MFAREINRNKIKKLIFINYLINYDEDKNRDRNEILSRYLLSKMEKIDNALEKIKLIKQIKQITINSTIMF